MSFAHPGAGQAGKYGCQAVGLDAHGRPAVLTAAAHVGVAAPATDQLAAMLADLTQKVKGMDKVIQDQADVIAGMAGRLDNQTRVMAELESRCGCGQNTDNQTETLKAQLQTLNATMTSRIDYLSNDIANKSHIIAEQAISIANQSSVINQQTALIANLSSIASHQASTITDQSAVLQPHLGRVSPGVR